MNTIIRPAEMQDIPDIYHLVYELAVFEKEPEALIISVEEYKVAFLENLVNALVAEVDGKIVGMAIYYTIFSTWRGKTLYLEDFFVRSEYRKQKLGQQLFDAFLEEAKKMGVRQVKWQVLDWNEIGIRFYEKNEAYFDKKWWNGYVFLSNIKPPSDLQS